MDFDVIIVGAGPSGSTLGRELSINGVSVLLIDKSRFPRDKTCAGGLMSHALRDFPYIEDFINCINTSLKCVSPNMDTSFEVNTDVPLMAMTGGRAQFDSELLNLAKKEGAALRLGEKVSSAKIRENFATVTLEDGEVLKSKIIIGADGASSVVAKSLGIGIMNNPDKFGIGIEAEIPLSVKACNRLYGKDRQVSLYLYYGGLQGYGWVFPKNNSVNVGLGASFRQGNRLKSTFQKFIEDLKKDDVLPSEVPPYECKCAPLPITAPTHNCYTERALLIGDAGGFCSASTGEGIYYGMLSGRTAANACLRCLDLDQYSKLSMKYFYKLSWKLFGEELNYHYLVRKKVLNNERRCRKAVNWAKQDEKLKKIFSSFLTGQQNVKRIPLKMAWHYIRCKFKEKMGKFDKPQADAEFERQLDL